MDLLEIILSTLFRILGILFVINMAIALRFAKVLGQLQHIKSTSQILCHFIDKFMICPFSIFIELALQVFQIFTSQAQLKTLKFHLYH